MLAYVYAGELWVHDGIKEVVFRAGSCVFIRKNHRIRFSTRAGENGQLKIVWLVFHRNFLIDFYQQIEKENLVDTNTTFTDSFLHIPSKVDIKSLFYSIIPYIDSSVQPSEPIMRLKLTEGVYTLLDADKRAAVALFDFMEPWKIDILDFLNENFMYDLSLEEIALYTGRSLAAFKRDFKKISDLSPMKWITKKRLETAHQHMKDDAKAVSDIYLEVGFKSLSHFSTAYKKEYGVAPTKREISSQSTLTTPMFLRHS